MSEHSAQNRAQLQSTRIDDPTMESSQETAQQREEDEDIRMMQDDVMGCHGTRSSLKALIRLFLKHHAKADQATIEVCVSEGTVLHSRVWADPILHREKGSGTWPQSNLSPRNLISHVNPVTSSAMAITKVRLATFLHSRFRFLLYSSS